MDTPAVLEVTNLVVDYRLHRGSSLRAVDHLSLELRQGQVLGIVGESGSGKSTLGKVVAGFLRPTSGQVLFPDESGEMRPRLLRRPSGYRDVQMIFQDSAGALSPRLPVWRIIGEALRPNDSLYQPWREPASELRDEVRTLLERVGLPPNSVFNRRPGELSGGQKQRVAIARALAASPVAMVCDESVSALDVSVRAIVLNLFQELSHETGIALLFITHDISVVAHLADEIAVMYDGQIVESGTPEQIIDAPKANYTRRLIAAVPTLERQLTEQAG
ncbi:MAG: ABC transporter ATP-binding protein [Solirubrobacteraceae bacterium]